MTIRWTSLLLLGATSLIPLVQDRRPQAGKDGYDWSTSWPGSKAALRADQLSEAMQGAWRLVKLTTPEERVPGDPLAPQKDRGKPERPRVGYLLVSGKYMAMEIHGDWVLGRIRNDNQPGRTQEIVTGVTQSGMYRFEIDEWSSITMRSLIGTTPAADGRFQFEPPETSRRYKVQVSGDRMMLRSEDERILLFQRLEDTRTQRDFYGRPIREEPEKPPEEEGGDAKDDAGGG